MSKYTEALLKKYRGKSDFNLSVALEGVLKRKKVIQTEISKGSLSELDHINQCINIIKQVMRERE